MCDYCEQEMQYALIEIVNGRMGLIDALEYEMMDKVYKSKNIQNAINRIDNEKIIFNEDAPLKIVSGVIKINPYYKENIKDHIMENYINKELTAYLEDRNFHDFGLVDIEIGASNEKNDIPFSALICAAFNVVNPHERAITAFVTYGNLSTFESLLNRDFILSINRQYESIEDLSETNWKNYISIQENRLSFRRN